MEFSVTFAKNNVFWSASRVMSDAWHWQIGPMTQKVSVWPSTTIMKSGPDGILILELRFLR